MIIKSTKTIIEYNQVKKEKIQSWIDKNFFKDSVTWEMYGANAIKVTDKTGDSMVVSLNELK
jgi:hypothetical protein